MINIIHDQYQKSRGGWSRFLEISCKNCGAFLFHYQKDGSGPLKRSYPDRIIGTKPKFDKKGYYLCEKCKSPLGFYEPYKKENNRPALRWAVQAINYKILPQRKIK